MFEWMGWPPSGITATATPTSGLTYHGIKPGTYTDGQPDESDEITAMAASVFHGGLMAELIFMDVAWTNPLFYPWAEDYQRANNMLQGGFGNHSSAGHAFAQRTALHILSVRWSRVKEIADVLVRCGSWPDTEGLKRAG